MPELADYTVEIRMYGYALFFIMAGMLHAFELAESYGKASDQPKVGNVKNWIALTL